MNKYLVKIAETAVLITGNPKYLNMYDGLPSRFYSQIQNILSKEGYDVIVDPGKEFTEPPRADLYVGHSSGSGRLRFVSPESRTISLADSSLHHPRDNAYNNRAVPNRFHFVLTSEMKKRLVEEAKKKAP